MAIAMAVAHDILSRPDIWPGDRLAPISISAINSGFAALDAELPGGGWPVGALTELLVDGVGFGELSLLTQALLNIRKSGGWSLLVAPPHSVHAPAWAATGIDLARLAIVSPASARDALWAMEQALNSGAPRAVVGWAPYADARALRRLQVAAASSCSLAFLFRPLRMAEESSAAPLRLMLAGEQGRLSVRILKRRGPPFAKTIQLTLPRPVRWRDRHSVHGAALAGHPTARPLVAV